MAARSPPPLTAAEAHARRTRINRLARRLGFVGRVEYRHTYSRTGGASYRQGATAEQDLLTVYVEAYERDADPEEFSLNAILAHERGHQLLVRHPRLARQVAGRMSAAGEEILASVVGAIICGDEADQHALMGKAVVEALLRGADRERVVPHLDEIKALVEAIL